MYSLTIILIVVGVLLAIILSVAAFTVWKFFRKRFEEDEDYDEKEFQKKMALRADSFEVPPIGVRNVPSQMDYFTGKEDMFRDRTMKTKSLPNRRSRDLTDYYEVSKSKQKTFTPPLSRKSDQEYEGFFPTTLYQDTAPTSKFEMMQKRISDVALEHLAKQGRKQSTLDLRRTSMTEQMILAPFDTRSCCSLGQLDESDNESTHSFMESFETPTMGAKKRQVGETRAGGSYPNLEDQVQKTPKRTFKKAGKINFITEFNNIEKNFEVHILRASDLAPKRDIAEINPYVRVYLIPGKKQKQGTRYQKGTKEPFINEKFIFTDVTSEDIDKYRLKLKVYNKGKMKKEVLGEVDIALSSIDLEKKENFNIDLYKKRSESSLASLNICLCHQATSSKLEVCIKEAKHLPRVGLSGNPDPYITVILFREKTTTRQNTKTKHNTRDPIFNETLEFEVSTDSTKPLSTYALVVTINNAGLIKKDEVMGHVIFSLTSPQKSAADHWKIVQESPHKYHTEWHSLIDPDEL